MVIFYALVIYPFAAAIYFGVRVFTERSVPLDAIIVGIPGAMILVVFLYVVVSSRGAPSPGTSTPMVYNSEDQDRRFRSDEELQEYWDPRPERYRNADSSRSGFEFPVTNGQGLTVNINGNIYVNVWGIRSSRGRNHTRRRLVSPSPVDLSDAVSVIEFSGDFDFDLNGESFQYYNYAALKGFYQVASDDCLYQPALIYCERNNEWDPNAVAVAIDGLVVGRVPRQYSAFVWRQLETVGGAAIVEARLWFDPRIRKNSARISMDLPIQFSHRQPAEIAPVTKRFSSKSEIVEL
jgi:hypothetical protein